MVASFLLYANMPMCHVPLPYLLLPLFLQLPSLLFLLLLPPCHYVPRQWAPCLANGTVWALLHNMEVVVTSMIIVSFPKPLQGREDEIFFPARGGGRTCINSTYTYILRSTSHWVWWNILPTRYEQQRSETVGIQMFVDYIFHYAFPLITLNRADGKLKISGGWSSPVWRIVSSLVDD